METFIYYDYWREMRKEPAGKGTYNKAEDARRLKTVISSFDTKLSDLRVKYAKILGSDGG